MGTTFHDDRITPVFPTSYFGSIAYFRELGKYNSVQFDAFEHFAKQSFRNRCEILTANGPLQLSVPVIKPAGAKTAIGEVMLDDSKNWRIQHWRTIQSAYNSSPYFEHYSFEIESVLFNPTNRLIELNSAITQLILGFLDFEIEFSLSQAYLLGTFPENEKLVAKNRGQLSAPPYIQVFREHQYFTDKLSILDALFCEGPLARRLLF